MLDCYILACLHTEKRSEKPALLKFQPGKHFPPITLAYSIPDCVVLMIIKVRKQEV